MAVVHSKWLEDFFSGALDADFGGTGASDFVWGFATNTSIDPDMVDDISDLTLVATGTAWTGPVDLANEVCGLDGSKDLLFDADDPAQIAQDASGGFSNGRTQFIGISGGPIIVSQVEASAFGNVDGPLSGGWPNGIWKLTI
jgi:hypothetical protein